MGEAPSVLLEGPELTVIGETVSFTATAADPDGDLLELRWLNSDDWRLIDGGDGNGAVTSVMERVFPAGGQVLVAANAIDDTGRMGFDSRMVTAYEPGDECSTPRVIPGGGPWPHTILTENRGATVGSDDPEVPCTIWYGDPNSGRWASIWFEFTPELSGTYTFSTCGSVPDTALSVWTGPACGPYEHVDGACNDDDRLRNCVGRDTDSWLELELEADTTIRLMVGTTEDIETGDLRITVDCPSCRPPPVSSTLLVPAAARVPGSQGSFWRSGLHLVNVGDEPTTTSVELLPGPGSVPALEDHELASGEALILEDVIRDLVGGRGTGALRLSSSAPIVATTRTATTVDGGSYGQGIPAVSESTVASDGAAVRLFGFSREDAFRTNLGLFNPGSDDVDLIVRFYDGETTKLAEAHHTLTAESWVQLNRVFEAHEIAGETDLIVVRQTSKIGSFSAYASVVDEQTGDPTYLGPTSVGRVGDPLWIPAVAHTDGVGGVEWRTDLTLCNPATGDLITRVELLDSNGVIAATTVHVPDGWVLSFDDVVADLLESSGAGALRISPSLGLVMATSRTYATTSQGSYGQGIPGATETEAFTTGERGSLPGVRQDDLFRTNIGFANAGENVVHIQVRAHAPDGEVLSTTTHRVVGSSWIQVNQALPEGAAYATFSSVTPGATYLAYASVVDRETDDPTYIAAVRAGDEVSGNR